MTSRGPHDAPDRGDANDESHRLAVFLRGLTIGALVGAAIAGSAIWERARRRVEQAPATPEPDPSQPDVAQPEG